MPAPQQQDAQQQIQNFALSTFGGLDTSSDPTAIADEDFSWLFDYFPVGNGYLPVLSGPTQFATGLAACNWLDYANLGGVDYAIHCDTAGKLSAVDIATGVASTIGTGFTPGGCESTMWSNTDLLVIDSALGYGYWDGASFTVVDATNKGISIAVHQGRVWIASGRAVVFSAPGSYTDFTTVNGGGAFAMNDPTLQGNIIALYERESILYIVGATSVNTIGDLTVPSGSTTPVFSNSNLQASIGTPYLRALADLQRIIFVASKAGVYALYGVNAPKVSDKLNGILGLFTTINGQLHCGVGNSLNQLIFCMLGTLTHPNYTGPAIACFVNKKWFLCQQGANLTALCSAVVNSIPTVIGADSAGKLYKLFTDTGATMQARADTKLFSFDSPIYDHEIIRGGVLVDWSKNDTGVLVAITDTGQQSATLSVSNALSFTGAGGAALSFTGSGGNPLTFFSVGAALLKTGFSLRGKHVGLSYRMTACGNWVRAFLMQVRKATAW